jgi:membrane fusion protein YbhG
MRRRTVAAIAIVLLAAAGLAAWRWYGSAEREAKAIRGSGIIEVTQVDAAFEVPGRMLERYVDEGVSLDRGEPVARLDERQYQLQVKRSQAAKEAAEARYRLVMQGSRAQEVDQALAALEAAQSEVRMQQREHDRIAKLAESGIVSQNDLDRVRNALDGARAARDRAQAQLDLLHEGFRTEEMNLAHTKLYAPIAGRVLSKSREQGEMVQAGTPIVTIGDLSRPWVNVYVGERDLGKIHLGMKAWVTVDAFPDQPFPGTVTFVSDRAEFTPKNIQTQDERVKLVYRIKVEVEPRDEALKPGMPADTILPLDGDHPES